MSETVFDWGNEMLDCLIQTFKFPGQFGTHIDFPGDFIKGGKLSEEYGARNMRRYIQKQIEDVIATKIIASYAQQITMITLDEKEGGLQIVCL